MKPTCLLPLVLLAGCASGDPAANQQVVIATKTQGPQAGPPPNAPQPEGCAVIDAATESDGLVAERRWLHDHYPGWKNAFVHSLSLSGDPAHRRYFDRDQIFTADEERITVCFDITAFYGKY